MELIIVLLMDHFKVFAKYGWTDVHYSNPFLPGETPQLDKEARWSVGVRTGPHNDTICIKYCNNDEEIDNYRSPKGNSINDAIHRAIALYQKKSGLLEGCRRVKH